jgi:hypothetical protein
MLAVLELVGGPESPASELIGAGGWGESYGPQCRQGTNVLQVGMYFEGPSYFV